MHRVDARDLIPEAPTGLEALVFASRSPEGPRRRLLAAGDLGLSGEPGRALERGEDPFRELRPALAGADLCFANLETPLPGGTAVEGAPFAAPDAAAERIAGAGFRLLSLANNHAADHGPEGLRHTLETLQRAGVDAVGAGLDADQARRLHTVELGDLRLGWLACARTRQAQKSGAGFWELDAYQLVAVVEHRRAEVDLLAVSIHAGYMFLDYPHPDHRHLAERLAAAGADLVLFHHAHVLQGVEVTAGGAVLCHNLGNLLFDWTEGELASPVARELQRSGALFVFELDRRGVCRAAAVPTRVDDGWTVRWARGTDADAALTRLERISRALTGDYSAAFRRQRARRNGGQILRQVGLQLRRADLGGLAHSLSHFRPEHLGLLWRYLRAGGAPER